MQLPLALSRRQISILFGGIVICTGVGLAGWVIWSAATSAPPTPPPLTSPSASSQAFAVEVAQTSPTPKPTDVVAGLSQMTPIPTSEAATPLPPAWTPVPLPPAWTPPPGWYPPPLPPPSPYPAGFVGDVPVMLPTFAPVTLVPGALTHAVFLPIITARSGHLSQALPKDWPQAYPALSASKLGAILLYSSDPAFFEMVRQGHPRVVKGIDDVSWAGMVKQDSPGTLMVGIRGGQEDAWVTTKTPQAAAHQYIEANLEHYQLNPQVDFWEAWNEYIADTPEKMDWFAQFEATRACEMQARGFRAAVGVFGVGWPVTYELMGHFIPALQAAYACGGIFTLHEYNAPTMACGVKPPGEANGIPGAPALSVPAGPLALRYRYWYEGYLKPLGMGDLPLVISEMGIDGLVNLGGCGFETTGAWKEHQAWWMEQNFGASGPEAYVNVLAWYDAQLQQDPYVIGATIFTGGATGETSWNRFDLHDVFPVLANYLRQVSPPVATPANKAYP